MLVGAADSKPCTVSGPLLRPASSLQALQAAQIVYQHAPSLQLQGEALTLLARAHHALGRMQEAFTFYQQVRPTRENTVPALCTHCSSSSRKSRASHYFWLMLSLYSNPPAILRTAVGCTVAPACCKANHSSLVGATELSCRLTARVRPSHSLLLQQANQLDSKLPLPKLGLAQVEVLRGQPINAVSILESVLLDVPQWIDALQASRCATLAGKSLPVPAVSTPST